MAAFKHQVGGDTMVVVVDNQAQAFERFKNLDPDRPHLNIHPFHVQMPRRTQIVLHVTNPHGEPGIHDVQIWIDAQGKHKEHRAIGRIPIEKITVIKIALGSGDSDRVRRLVDGVIIALGQHRLLPS